MPLENIAQDVLDAIYHQQQTEWSWNTLLWAVAERNEYWISYDALPMPTPLQINCGGLGGAGLWAITLASRCRRGKRTGVAAGYTTGIDEIATLFSHTQDPCERWELLGFGKAAIFYRRTQIAPSAARLLPAHRRLPHKAFLSGLWWKLLSIQPTQLLTTLPMLGHLRTAAQPSPEHFVVEGFSAGSYTGAVIALAIRCLWPQGQITARLGAIAMRQQVLAALVATSDTNRHHHYLVHAEADTLCDWRPSDRDLQMLQHSLHVTYVDESARWMGSSKHKYWHWLHCRLPIGRVRLTDLKLSHPEVVPSRDRMAAPMRLPSWIRFETLMLRADWAGAIGMLVSNIHKSDQDLLQLLHVCVPDQTVTSMEEPQALLLRNFRVGSDENSDCARWLTEMARDTLAPIPFREVFVILALFLPQLSFSEGVRAQQSLWSSPAVCHSH